MASIKDLKKRIGTVKNTQQTTKAMKMVSAAKLRRAQDAIISQRPYSKQLSQLLGSLIALPEIKIDSPLLTRDQEVQALIASGGKKKVLVVTFSSDRGLCGGFNSNVIKATFKQVNAFKKDASIESATFSFVGRRGYDFFKTKKIGLGQYYVEAGGKVTFAKAKALAKDLVDRFVSGECDEIKIIYNEFKNAVLQQTMVETLLPLSAAMTEKPIGGSAQSSGTANDSANALGATIVKPSPEVVAAELLAKHIPLQIFRVLLESQAGEHGARMSAMENATKNAGEMIKKLTLQYNKQRQAGITKELLEIISGSESQSQSA